MRTTCLGGLWRSFVLVPGIFAPASFILIAFSYNLNELFICNIWACTSVYTNSIYTTCEYRCTRRSSQLSCVLIIPNWFLVYASYQTSYVFTCNSNCHVSYYDLFCPYLKKKNPSKHNWQNGLCYFFWSCLLVNKVYTLKWMLLCIMFRLYCTFTAGTDTKNCHKERSLSMCNSCFKSCLAHTLPFFLFKCAYFSRVLGWRAKDSFCELGLDESCRNWKYKHEIVLLFRGLLVLNGINI